MTVPKSSKTPHVLKQTETGYECDVCKLTWKKEPRSGCIGIPVYTLATWPSHLKSERQLLKAGINPRYLFPKGVIFQGRGPTLWLYNVDDDE